MVTPEFSHTNLYTQGKKSDANFQTANSIEDGHSETTPTHFCGSEFSFFSLMDPEFHLKASSLLVLTLACISAWPPLLKLTFCDHRKPDRMDDSILFNPLGDHFSYGGGEEGREREEVGDRGLEGVLESVQKKESVGVET